MGRLWGDPWRDEVCVRRLLVRVMRGPGAPDHGDGVKGGKAPAEGGNADGHVEDEHDARSKDGAVEHAKRAEEERKDQGEDDALAICHAVTCLRCCCQEYGMTFRGLLLSLSSEGLVCGA